MGKDVASLIPSIYYDLIARISAGIPFLVILFWPQRDQYLNTESNAGILLLLALGGYLVGLGLSSWSGIFLLATKAVLKKINAKKKLISHEDILSLSHPLVSDVWQGNKEAADTVAKMAAEAVLSENLLAGYTILIAIHCLVFPLVVFSKARMGLLIATGAALLLMVVHRNAVYLFRLDKYLTLFSEVASAQGTVESKRPGSSDQPETRPGKPSTELAEKSQPSK